MAEVRIARDADPATLSGFDVVVDARSPGEFALDHVPGAVNLPVLSDAERAEVGTIYVQDSRFKARRLGAAYVARNVARHLDTAMADWPGSHQPLIYCWRGGMRSNAMAVILAQVGWRTTVLAGGYRTYRRRVVERLYDGAPLDRVVLIDGHTGCGKTEILHRLAARGVQTLDLEAMAAHRGSLFGDLPGRPQPGQRLFESHLLEAIERLDPARPVAVEAESSKVGQIMLPPGLWGRMAAAPRIVLEAPADARARHLALAYADVARDLPRLEAALARLPGNASRRRIEMWTALARDGAYADFAGALIETHYDPAYRRSSKRLGPPHARLALVAPLGPAAFDAAAAEIEVLIAAL